MGGEIQICLWREANLVPITDGMLIKVSHLRGRKSPTYGLSFHSTSFTEIELLSMTNKIKVEGLRILEGGDVELLQGNGTRITVARAIWLENYSIPVVAMPSWVNIKVENGKVSKVEKVDEDLA
ncbi:hypothetical protein OYC64_018512 [Pagothenia borchgrevinki]|uniref:Uncharacterized protein n=1 Tax=Pagothenia borchgrevinki TaxID=8213 RepID=A0ABD2GP54_PAGBO